jgi:hypothetical protein
LGGKAPTGVGSSQSVRAVGPATRGNDSAPPWRTGPPVYGPTTIGRQLNPSQDSSGAQQDRWQTRLGRQHSRSPIVQTSSSRGQHLPSQLFPLTQRTCSSVQRSPAARQASLHGMMQRPANSP